MPKKAMDYSKTIIYKIVCNNLNIKECYVGHTTNFIKRKNLHKSNCTNNNSKTYNLKIYQFIRANGGWDNWSMIEIEKFSCQDINEAIARERYWYEILNSNLNTDYPGRTQKEYRETNKEQLLEYQKEYYETNKQYFVEYQKEYRETNKEQIVEYQKEYRETNKEQIIERQKQKFDCECGGKYTYCNKIVHLNSKKHKKYLTIKDNSLTKQESILEPQPILHSEI